ncbi:MAG: hypothetical protein VKS61_09595 [Candidatus Sericytochromatia bacterium]|nr:hypothetical protein [Candidatus Sericytochromatia bacterium]
MPVATSEGAWELKAHDRLTLWANSPEAGLALDNSQGRGFWNLTASWENCMAGAFVATPEGVVAGTSRDGSAIATTLNLQPGVTQRWSLKPNVSGAYRFAVVSGTGVPGAQPLHARFARDAAARGVGFAIHLGDGVEAGANKGAAAFRERLRAHAFPTYCLPGRQELAASGGRAAWSRLFGNLPIVFRIGQDHFLLVDNAAGHLSPAQERWLQATLDQAVKAKARRVFVFAHRPLVDVRPGFNQGMQDINQVRRLLKLFGGSHVDTVFGGRIGVFASERRRGIRLVTSAGGGTRLGAPPARGGYHHWVRVDVPAEGPATITAERLVP